MSRSQHEMRIEGKFGPQVDMLVCGIPEDELRNSDDVTQLARMALIRVFNPTSFQFFLAASRPEAIVKKDGTAFLEYRLHTAKGESGDFRYFFKEQKVKGVWSPGPEFVYRVKVEAKDVALIRAEEEEHTRTINEVLEKFNEAYVSSDKRLLATAVAGLNGRKQKLAASKDLTAVFEEAGFKVHRE